MPGDLPGRNTGAEASVWEHQAVSLDGHVPAFMAHKCPTVTVEAQTIKFKLSDCRPNFPAEFPLVGGKYNANRAKCVSQNYNVVVRRCETSDCTLKKAKVYLAVCRRHQDCLFGACKKWGLNTEAKEQFVARFCFFFPAEFIASRCHKYIFCVVVHETPRWNFSGTHHCQELLLHREIPIGDVDSIIFQKSRFLGHPPEARADRSLFDSHNIYWRCYL
jgi:hypothetical protein